PELVNTTHCTYSDVSARPAQLKPLPANNSTSTSSSPTSTATPIAGMLQRSGTTNRVGRTVVRSATSASPRARGESRVAHRDVAIIARPFFHRQNAMSREEGPHGKLWGGRFSEPTDQFVERFTASIGFDARLYHCDIAGSIAHAKMLASVGVITSLERDRIVTG